MMASPNKLQAPRFAGSPDATSIILTERFGQDITPLSPKNVSGLLAHARMADGFGIQAESMVMSCQTPGGDEDNAKRRQIIDGARAVFMTLGFDGASMGEIARAAGVSKGTLYVYFTDKNALFEAIVEQEVLEQGRAAFNFDPGRDVATTLHEFGTAYVQLLCRPGGGSAIRTVMAIAERMPEVGSRFYEKVLALTINRLSDYLAVRVGLREVTIGDTQLAAAQFMQMCQATLFQPYIFQAKPSPTAQEIEKVVFSAVRVFLAGYRTEPG
jgi:AcrR family transcriptional regulator